MTQYPWANFWIIATVAAIVAHTLYVRSQGRLFVFDPIFTFWGGFFICYIEQPLNYADVFVGWHNVAVFDWTLFYSFLGVLCVIWGYEMDTGMRIAKKLPNFTRELEPDIFFNAGLLLAAAAVVDYYFAFQTRGGMWEWLSYPRGGTDPDKISGYAGELEKVAPLAAYLLLLHAYMHPVGALRKIFAWAFSITLWFWYLYLGTRARIIGVAIYSAAAYYTPKHKSPSFVYLLPAFMVLMILTNFQANYRSTFTNLSFHLEDINWDNAKAKCLPTFLGGDKEAQRKKVDRGIDFNVCMAVVELVPSKAPYSYGWNFAEFITRWIPRSVWPDKIYPSAESVQAVYREGGLSHTMMRDHDLLMGPSFSFLAFWFNILGPFMVVLGGIYTGILFRTIRSFLEKDLGSEGNLVVYNTCLVIGFVEAAATPFTWLFDFPVTSFLPIMVLLYLCRKRGPRGQMAPVAAGTAS